LHTFLSFGGFYAFSFFPSPPPTSFLRQQSPSSSFVDFFLGWNRVPPRMTLCLSPWPFFLTLSCLHFLPTCFLLLGRVLEPPFCFGLPPTFGFPGFCLYVTPQRSFFSTPLRSHGGGGLGVWSLFFLLAREEVSDPVWLCPNWPGPWSSLGFSRTPCAFRDSRSLSSPLIFGQRLFFFSFPTPF